MSTEDADEVVHVSEDLGLWIPPEFREFEQQLVIRTPRATIQHFGSTPMDAYYGMVDASHFGEVPTRLDTVGNPNQNPHLRPNRVSLKPQGEEATVFEVDGLEF